MKPDKPVILPEENIFNGMQVVDYIDLTVEDWIFMLEESEKPVGEPTLAMKRAIELYKSENNPLREV